MEIKFDEIEEEYINLPFSTVTYSTLKRVRGYFKKAKSHKEYLLEYLNGLVLHSKTEKCRVINSGFCKNEIDQPELYCIKEPISWEDASKINREIELITNTINELEND